MSKTVAPSTVSPIEDLDKEKRKLEIDKLHLEKSKIELEKQEFEKPWYKRPQWWSVLVPLIIGVGTIYIAFSTGLISVERLKNEKEELIRTIKIQKDSLTIISNALNSKKDSIKTLIELQQLLTQNKNQIVGKLDNTITQQKTLIQLYKQQELKRINNEIYMYEDHDSLYSKMDALLKDSTSVMWRKQKLIELKKARDAIKL